MQIHHLSGRPLGANGVTRLDIAGLLAALALLVAVALPSLAGVALRELRVLCANNLQLMGVGLQTWAFDHGDNVPWLIPSAAGGSNGRTLAYESWRVISNHVVSPQLMVCPASKRQEAASFGRMLDANLSYVVGSDSDLRSPSTFVSADRDLEGGSQAACGIVGGAIVTSFPGAFGISDSYQSRWSRTNHVDRGNILTADGGVKQVDSVGLRRVMSLSTDIGNDCHSLIPR